jgi:hypothetical protein
MAFQCCYTYINELLMFFTSARFRSSMIIALAAAAACKDSTGPPVPKSVTMDASVALEGVAGIVLPAAPTFVVKDQSGHALAGVSVTVAVTAGGGTLTDAPTTSRDGPTPVGTWKLGNVAGVNTITITVGSLTPLVINVTGKPGAPAGMIVVAGDNQSALAGTPVQVPPAVQVRDQFGNGVPGVPVTFTVSEGEGIVSSTPVNTDATGKATSPQWTLGRSAVPQTLRAFTAGNFSAAVSASIQSDYDVDLRFFGPEMPLSTAGMFTAAAAKIKAMVIGDVPDVFVPTPLDLANDSTGCGVDGLPTAFTGQIDDVIIYASVGPIDGVNNILAFSFPCFIRTSPPNNQTVFGIMKFDSDDLNNMIAQGNLTDVIQHEMLHVVGFGTLWNLYGVLAGAGTAATRYTGALGVGGCISMGGATVCPGSVPVENLGGAGTADSHWRESVFFNELMTGFIQRPSQVQTRPINPLSVMTIQSIGDIGYQVNPKAADDYTIPGTSAARTSGQLNVDNTPQVWETVMRPKYQITRSGRISLVPKQ